MCRPVVFPDGRGGTGCAPVHYEWQAPGWLLPALWVLAMAGALWFAWWLGRRGRV